MSSDAQKIDSTATAIVAAANTKAAEKLADAVHGLVQLPHKIVDYIAGPKRITSIHTAKAEARITEARTDAEIERLRAETADFVLDREMRKTLNRQAIVAEAQKALPSPDTTVSDEKVSPDFIHSFFDEFDGISDPEVHKIIGKLLAGEVVRPGSFPRRTMRVLRDLDSADFKLFTSLCRFNCNIAGLTPLVFQPNGSIYKKHDLNFGSFTHLQSLGLITFDGINGYARLEISGLVSPIFDNITVNIELSQEQTSITIGHVIFTDAGMRLAQLTNAAPTPEFVDYAVAQWNSRGYKAHIVQKTTEAQNIT